MDRGELDAENMVLCRPGIEEVLACMEAGKVHTKARPLFKWSCFFLHHYSPGTWVHEAMMKVAVALPSRITAKMIPSERSAISHLNPSGSSAPIPVGYVSSPTNID